MKEKPILFSAPMVRAILEGRKTMTRRVVKKQCDHTGIGRDESGVFVHRHCEHDTGITRCLYGQPGDRLWVRETFTANEFMECRYKADGKQFLICNGRKTETEYFEKKWKPSIFMPRWASRITLEITAVRVERLQDISEEDAKNEGANAIAFMELKQMPPSLIDKTGELYKNSYRYGFYNVWSSINGEDSWNANPWVWVIEFKRIEQ